MVEHTTMPLLQGQFSTTGRLRQPHLHGTRVRHWGSAELAEILLGTSRALLVVVLVFLLL